MRGLMCKDILFEPTCWRDDICVMTCGRAVFRRTEFILRQTRDTVETGMPEAGLGLAGICTSTSMLVLARTRNPAAAPCKMMITRATSYDDDDDDARWGM